MHYLDTHARGGRAMWVVHRRGGKDLTAMHQTCSMMHERTGVYWHVYPTGEQARKAIWEGFTSDGQRIMEQVFPKAIRRSPRDWYPNAEMVVELKCGSIWRLLGSDRVEVVGAGPVGVVFSEYALAKPSGWDFVAPMLRENGGWAAFITTPRGSNHAKRLFESARVNPEWFCELQTLYDTRAYDPEKTIAEERAAGRPEALIRQEYLCDWTAALVGSVWGDLVEAIEKRGDVSAFKHEEDGVFTAWDLGISDSTAIWFWRVVDGGAEFIDYYESHGKPMSHYCDEVDSRPYKYVKHWLPHDARARTWVSGASAIEQMLARWGDGRVAIGPALSLLDGIQAARWLLQQKVRFHQRTSVGVETLKQYHYEWDSDRRTFRANPEHDWSSHGADAFRYAAVAMRASDMIRPKPPEPKLTHVAPVQHNLNALFEERERRARRW